jgi:hypothetical protein
VNQIEHGRWQRGETHLCLGCGALPPHTGSCAICAACMPPVASCDCAGCRMWRAGAEAMRERAASVVALSDVALVGSGYMQQDDGRGTLNAAARAVRALPLHAPSEPIERGVVTDDETCAECNGEGFVTRAFAKTADGSHDFPCPKCCTYASPAPGGPEHTRGES